MFVWSVAEFLFSTFSDEICIVPVSLVEPQRYRLVEQDLLDF